MKPFHETLADDLGDCESEASGSDAFFGRESPMCLQLYRTMSGSTHWCHLGQASIERNGIEAGWFQTLDSAHDKFDDCRELDGMDGEVGQKAISDAAKLVTQGKLVLRGPPLYPTNGTPELPEALTMSLKELEDVTFELEASTAMVSNYQFITAMPECLTDPRISRQVSLLSF